MAEVQPRVASKPCPTASLIRPCDNAFHILIDEASRKAETPFWKADLPRALLLGGRRLRHVEMPS